MLCLEEYFSDLDGELWFFLVRLQPLHAYDLS